MSNPNYVAPQSAPEPVTEEETVSGTDGEVKAAAAQAVTDGAIVQPDS